MGRKKISIQRIYNKRLRSVSTPPPHLQSLITQSLGYIQQKEEGLAEKGDGALPLDWSLDFSHNLRP